MKITITARKLNLKDSFKERVEKKLSKFNKFFGDDADANVTVTLEKNRQTVEVTIKYLGYIYRAEETAEDMEDALDVVVERLARQIRKNKTRLERRVKTAIDISDFAPIVPEEDDEIKYNVVRSKHFNVKPMDVEEAILQMNLLGHEFYMFRNMETNEINVVYQRKNGDYGLLEADDR